MIREYTYKFRLYPTEDQKILLNKHFGCVRFVYNYFLDKRTKFYIGAKEKNLKKKSLNYLDDAKELVGLKNKEETKWLYECCAQSLQQSLKHLDGAFNSFYKKLKRYPNFKKRGEKQSFRVPQGVMIKENKLYIIKFPEGIKFDNHRLIEGEIRNATITKNPAGQYFASIMVFRNIESKPKLEKTVGIDLGIKTLVVCSDGKTYNN